MTADTWPLVGALKGAVVVGSLLLLLLLLPPCTNHGSRLEYVEGISGDLLRNLDKWVGWKEVQLTPFATRT
jgi:hypothetical protein